MGLNFKKRYLLSAAAGLLSFFSGTVFSKNSTLPRCSVQHLGKWVDLSSLNSIEFNSNCRFTYTGALCKVSGDYLSTPHSEGRLFLYNKAQAAHPTCPAKGEHSCSFSIEQNSFVLKCPPQFPVKWTRVVPNDSTPVDKLEDDAKTLFLLEGANTQSLKLHLEKLARMRNLEATTALGYNFFYGSHGFNKDFSEAIFWNRLAASRGSRGARVLVGTQYLYGLGVTRDLARAEEYFLTAAEGDDPVHPKALAESSLRPGRKISKRPNETSSSDRGVATAPNDPYQPSFSKGIELFQEPEKDFFSSGIFWMGGGVTVLGIQSSADTFNDLRFLVSLRTSPLSLWGDLKLEGILDYALPLTSQLKSMSFSQIEGQLHYDIPIAPSVTLKPTFSFLRLQFEDAVTRLGIVGGQMGLGLGLEALLDDDWSVELTGRTLASGRGSLVSGSQTLNISLLQSNYALQLFIEKKSLNQASYGFGLQLQNISLLGTQSDTIRLTQYAGQFFWNF